MTIRRRKKSHQVNDDSAVRLSTNQRSDLMEAGNVTDFRSSILPSYTTIQQITGLFRYSPQIIAK